MKAKTPVPLKTISMTPPGSRISAQGCAAGATLGNSPKTNLDPERVTRRSRIRGISSAARALGVQRDHLRMVVNGQRISPGLLARYHQLPIRPDERRLRSKLKKSALSKFDSSDYERHFTRITQEILEERIRQDTLVATGKLPFNCSNAVSGAEKSRIIGEESGEVCKASYEFDNPSLRSLSSLRLNLRTELIQLAACCIAWLESMEETK